jgi:6-phosphogluconate dehydrogenase
MELAMIGLGKMGLNLATRLVRRGHRVIGYDLNKESIQNATRMGVEGAASLGEALQKLESPRVVWIMVPSGKATNETIEQLSTLLAAGDSVIDGGNTYYKATIQNASILESKGIDLVDAGTSGGIWGLDAGYSLMLGGKEDVIARLRPIFETLAPATDLGWGRVGPQGAGHFVKMIHNGIEYGMMQALAEGFSIMQAKRVFGLDLLRISEIWQNGSVVRSWLLDLTTRALKDDPELTGIVPWVEDSGEGRWTAEEAIELGIPAQVITLALQTRFASRDEGNYAARLLAALRNQFGGHPVKTAD